MESYAAQVDVLIRAESEEAAESMISNLLNAGLSLEEEPRVVDWSWGGSLREEYQTPVRYEDNPFEHFNARVPQHLAE